MTFRFLSLIVLLLQLSGQLAAQEAERGQAFETCTLIGCDSAAVVSIQLSAGGIPKYDLRLDVDDAKVSCTFPELSGDVAFGSGMPCGRVANITVHKISSGKIEALLVIHSRPSRITSSLLASGNILVERVYLPVYVEHSPNGSNCEPHCRFWRTTWMI